MTMNGLQKPVLSTNTSDTWTRTSSGFGKSIKGLGLGWFHFIFWGKGEGCKNFTNVFSIQMKQAANLVLK